jgi:hypothetical protein
MNLLSHKLRKKLLVQAPKYVINVFSHWQAKLWFSYCSCSEENNLFLCVYLFIYLLFIYSHVHTLFGSFLHSFPLPHSYPHPSQFQAGPVLPLSLILLKKRQSHNKEDKAFLLVELRIAIQRDSYYCFCVTMCYNSCWFNFKWLYTGSWSPTCVDLCHFKVSVLVPLEWGQ